MSEQFTATELVMISLVLNQNADRYDGSERMVRETSTKAREMADDLQGDSSE